MPTMILSFSRPEGRGSSVLSRKLKPIPRTLERGSVVILLCLIPYAQRAVGTEVESSKGRREYPKQKGDKISSGQNLGGLLRH